LTASDATSGKKKDIFFAERLSLEKPPHALFIFPDFDVLQTPIFVISVQQKSILLCEGLISLPFDPPCFSVVWCDGGVRHESPNLTPFHISSLNLTFAIVSRKP